MTDTVLVTGGAGFIGSQLVAHLCRGGDTVRVLDDCSTGDPANLDGCTAELVRGDVRDPALLREVCQGVKRIFHFAARPSVPESIEDPVGSTEVNLMATVQLLAAARTAGVERLLFASSSAVYGEPEQLPLTESSPTEPLSPYGIQKLSCEHHCRVASLTGGPDTICFRFFNIFGPGQRSDSAYAAAVPIFVERCRAGRPPRIHGDGSQTRDFIHVQDVVEACVLASTAEGPWAGEVFNLGRGEATTIDGLARAVMSEYGVSGDPEFTEARAGDILHSIADVSRLRQVFAERSITWQPRISLQDGLAALAIR